MTRPTKTSERLALLSQLLSAYELRREQGMPVSPEELCADYPELATELRERIDVLRKFERLAGDTSGGPNGTVVDIPPPSLSPPGFEIIEELGRGGMGIVFRAVQASLNRQVALKLLLGSMPLPADERRRLPAEAEIVASLQHPHIVHVHEVGEHEGHPYFVMELVEGQTLAEAVRRQPFPPPAAAQLTRTLAQAVHYAHERGVIHRDLKPANVLVSRDGSERRRDAAPSSLPKIVDFGLATMGSDDARAEANADGKTGAVGLIGTPSYMAPEQTGQSDWPIGRATDVYGLGAILYELLTGRPPFLAATPVDTVQQVVSDEPVPPRRLQPKIDRDLETICLKCLAKDPDRRYRSAADLADDLDCFLGQRSIAARRSGPIERGWKWVRRHRPLAALFGVVILATLGGLLLAVRHEAELHRSADQLGKQARLALDAQAEAERFRALAEEREEHAQRELIDATATIQSLLNSLDWPGADPDRSMPAAELRERQMRATIECYERLSQRRPDDVPVKRELAKALRDLGVLRAQRLKGDFDVILGRSADLAESLRGQLPDREVDEMCVHCLEQRAMLLFPLGRIAEAEQDFIRLAGLWERIAPTTDSELRRELSHRRLWYAAVASQSERAVEADAMYVDLVARTKRARERFPFSGKLADMYVRIAMERFVRTERQAENADTLQRLLPLMVEFKSAIDSEPATLRPIFERGLAECHYRRSVAKHHLNAHSSAARSLRRAIRIERRLLETNPEDREAVQRLSRYERTLRSWADSPEAT